MRGKCNIKNNNIASFWNSQYTPHAPQAKKLTIDILTVDGCQFWSSGGITPSPHRLNHVKNRESKICWMKHGDTSARSNNWAFSSLPPYPSDVLWYIGWIWRKKMRVLTTIRYPTMFILLLHSNYSNHSPPRVKWGISQKIDDATASCR